MRVESSPMGSVARDGCFESVITTNPYAATKSHCYWPRGDPNWFRSRRAEFSFDAWRSTEEVIAEGDVVADQSSLPWGKPGKPRGGGIPNFPKLDEYLQLNLAALGTSPTADGCAETS